jgi:hypothetical protein
MAFRKELPTENGAPESFVRSWTPEGFGAARKAREQVRRTCESERTKMRFGAFSSSLRSDHRARSGPQPFGKTVTYVSGMDLESRRDCENALWRIFVLAALGSLRFASRPKWPGGHFVEQGL